MFIEASYSLQPDDIVMPGAIDPPRVIPRSRMTEAPSEEPEDSKVRWKSYNNTSIMEFFAHTGTHIDVPFHVDPEGFKLHEFGINDFIFDHPVLLEIPKQNKEKISVEELEPHKEDLAKADILLIYTGFSKTRKKDQEGFVKNQPSFTLEAANYLARSPNTIPEIKMVVTHFLISVDKANLAIKERELLNAVPDNLKALVMTGVMTMPGQRKEEDSEESKEDSSIYADPMVA